MLSHFAQYAHKFEVILEDASVDLRVTFDSAKKYGLSNMSTAFNKVVFKVYLKSPSPVEKVRALALFSENVCHTNKSLQVPVPVYFEAILNNKKLIEETSED